MFSQQSGRIPILMYHSISNAAERGHPYYRTVTDPHLFAQQMQYLHNSGYIGTSVSAAMGYLEGAKQPERRPVAISFDDGYQNFYHEAFPVMERYGFTSTVYLPTAYIGNATRTFKGVECLTWGQVKELKNAGVEFGSHTVTHPQLHPMKVEQIRNELQESKTTIEQELGCPVSSFAYPYKFPEADRAFTATLRGLLEETGYENGVSTIIGTAMGAGEKYFMKRLPVNSCDDDGLLQAKLEGAYNWLHYVQHAVKMATVAGNRYRCAG